MASMGSIQLFLCFTLCLCYLSAVAGDGVDDVDSVDATIASKRRGEPKSGPGYAGGWGREPYEDDEPYYRHRGYRILEPPFVHDSEHYPHHGNHLGRGPRGRKGRKGDKGDKGDKGADGMCTPDRTYTVRSTALITAPSGLCTTASGSSDPGDFCAAAQCVDGDILVVGTCTVKAGVGRVSSPLCRAKDGTDVKCEDLGPTPSGWACSSDNFPGDTTTTGEIEAVATCCAAALPRNLVLSFDDLRDEGEAEVPVPQIYKGFEWSSSARATNGDEVASALGDCVTGFKTGQGDKSKSSPNVLSGAQNRAVSMTALPGFVFTVPLLSATAAWADGVVATFVGYDGDGTELGTVDATVNQSGPTAVDLKSLGRVSTLKMFTSTCGNDARNSCSDAASKCSQASESKTDLVIGNINLTVYPEPKARNTWRPLRAQAPWSP